MALSDPPGAAAEPASEAAEGPALLAVGIDHRSAPLELRERVAFSREDSEGLLLRLMARPEVAEAYLISTCNRTEVYLRPREQERAFRAAMELAFARAPEVERDGRFWVLHDSEAARHLLAVACGLESMVLGEPEILGQVKRSAELAEAVGSCGTVVKRLLRSALQAGRRARAETEIGEGAVSLGYAVVELARHIFVGVEGRSCLVLGGGETAVLAARALVEKGVRDLRFALRGTHRHEELGQQFPGARLTTFQERYATLADCDVLIASTSADEPVIEAGELRQVMRQRRSRPLLVVDLGVPRNVGRRVGRLDNVFLHDLDSLQHLVARNLEHRRAEVPRVEAIVAEELEHFGSWYQGLAAEPLVAELQRRAERIRLQEVEGARDRFPTELQDELDRLTRSLVRKILHHPSTRLRAGGAERRLAHLELARELFQLGEGEEE
ncbi:MAG TPA: glutamyl-tRNA reductase [Thermoanaerobaculia bacterium]|jgi:glutamyl-tRNA reductase|nr:glutamyl-tRNA reductase [Thermoanaerobaculia bacterium]